eukprot:PRCOL_00003925-RA
MASTSYRSVEYVLMSADRSANRHLRRLLGSGGGGDEDQRAAAVTHEALERAGGDEAWAKEFVRLSSEYKFDYKLRWPESQELGLGTYHTSELPFVFRHAWPQGLRHFDAEEWAIADLFNTFWGNFAGTADPNVGAQTPPLRWEQFSGTASYLRINHSPSMQQGLAKDVCDILDEVPLEL